MELPNTSRLGKKGFTLVEIIISIGILAFIMAAGLFMTTDNFRSYLSRSERDLVVSELQSARARAMANLYKTPWGACYDGSSYILFRGTTYSAAASTNESIAANSNAVVTSTGSQFSCSNNGLVFAQLSGTTTATTVTIVQNAKTATVSTNNEGAINW